MAGPQAKSPGVYTGYNNRRAMKGFSLLEVLIAVVIFSFIMAGMYGVLSVANQSYSTDTALVMLGQQARQIMFWMLKDMREASSVSITNIDNDSDSIVFDSIMESGIQYYREGEQVIREYPAGTKRVVGNNIIRLKFARSGNLLDIHLVAEDTLPSNINFSFPLREQIRLRNE
jgi:prepilin-type N-terminal cleavage/methylation domain-containing protein